MNFERNDMVGGGILIASIIGFAAIVLSQFESITPAIEANIILFQLILAASVIAVFRTAAGVKSFGVFAPAIIAFAWIQIGAVWGLLLITYLFVLALSTRLAVDRFSLATSHRVAILITVVSLGLVVLSAISTVHASMPGLTNLLFPTIITAWYGERFVSETKDVGWAGASRRLFWTTVLIFLSFLVGAYQPLVTWFAHTPLAWAGLIAVHLYLGITTPIQISEYFRFQTLRRAIQTDEPTLDILTMRVRNREFISRYNPQHLLASLDKLFQKRLLHGLEIPTPETYLLLQDRDDVDKLAELLDDHEQLAIKPTSGLGGEGIIVVTGRTDRGFETSRGPMTKDELLSHTLDILGGRYEAGYATSGSGYVESLVKPRGDLRDICGSGVPDLRIIVFQGVPIMAMARLPTEESKGAANLHGGAVGVAVGISDGQSRGAYQQSRDRWLDHHPDTGKELAFSIDDWAEILRMASKAGTGSHLGYAGVDIVFDEDEGPLVLEVNRRPGLGIQNVNMAGLLKRLRFAEQSIEYLSVRSAADRVSTAMEWDASGWEVSADEQ